jgi:two-component system, OmpR family, response regulator QseB
MRLLLIEDDPMVGRAMQAGLLAAGFALDWVRDGRAGELALANAEHDLVLLDLGLPVKDGMALLRAVRARDDPVPVIIVSARDTLAERIGGLDAGADDYLLKPFDLDELIARVHALLRRAAGSASGQTCCGGLLLDARRRMVSLDGVPVTLTAREFALLEALMRRPGAVISRQRLEDTVYAWGQEVASNVVEVHLYHLRQKLGATRIVNVRGAGYRMADC